VDWWPWGPEAFATAQAQGKPVLVSVGYSSCHWCHVMARESFEQPWIAELMNRHFVCIKVDREEHPEVDKLMMDAVQMVQGHGGWPLNAFCLPDGRPFFGGTYFPPEDRGQGQVPWPQLLMRVADFYHRNQTELAANADAIARNLTHLTRAPDADGTAPGPADLLGAGRRLCEQLDEQHGGFGGAPKFPAPSSLDLLLALRGSAAVAADRPFATRLDAAITLTLGSMARGGLFDQVGGGFHRYCVDRDWTVPHFEKMLYDNAQLVGTYAEAWARYRDPLYARVVAETIDWWRRELTTGDGLLAASLDADTDHHEGLTYVWKAPEVAEVLGAEAFDFAQVYGLSDRGNFEGANIPKLKGRLEDRDRLAHARAKLLARRDLRPQPGRDDKALLGWNALAIRGLVQAAWIFGRRDWRADAGRLAATLWARCASGEGADLALRAVVHGTTATVEGTLPDYAWLAEAELALAATAAWAGDDPAVHKRRAEALLRAARRRFGDPHELGYFLVGAERADLSVRQKDWFDNAVPAGNSSLLHGFSGLRAATGDEVWARELSELARAYGGVCRQVPHGAAHALTALVREAIGPATLKTRPDEDWESLRRALVGDETTPPHRRPFRPVFLQPDDATTGFQLCVGSTCLAPVATAGEAADLL
jgi:uncharacterized protein YyaL (SSP411 family)